MRPGSWTAGACILPYRMAFSMNTAWRSMMLRSWYSTSLLAVNLRVARLVADEVSASSKIWV